MALRPNLAKDRTVIIDAGIATEENFGFLKANGFHYIVVSRGKADFVPDDTQPMHVIRENESYRLEEIPFYVAAPRSTIDLDVADGRGIPIEERPAREVTHLGATQLAPEGVKVRNLAFDVTPHALVTAIITEAGIARPPYEESVQNLLGAR